MNNTREAMKENNLAKEKHSIVSGKLKTAMLLTLGGWVFAIILYPVNQLLAVTIGVAWPIICFIGESGKAVSDPRYRAVASGLNGEEYVHRLLSRFSQRMVLLNQVLLPNSRSRTGHTEVDFVLVGRKALYLVETKNNGGYIQATNDAPEWHVRHQSGKLYSMRNPVRQVLIQKKVLEQSLRQKGLAKVRIQPTVAFSNPHARVDYAGSVSVPIFTRPMNDLIARIERYEKALEAYPDINQKAVVEALKQLQIEALQNAARIGAKKKGNPSAVAQ